MELKHIVVPLDGSSASRFALPTGVCLARASGARLHLVHVFQPMPHPLEDLTRLPAPDEARSYVERIAAEASDSGRVSTAVEVIEALFADEALLAYARSLPADLLVMATHGRGGASRLWLGSVADSVTRHADRPVLLVRSQEGTPPNPAGGVPFRHILIPLDGSTAAEAALEPAVAIGGLGGARLTLLRVVPARTPLPLIEDPGSAADAVHRAAVGHAGGYLTEVARRLNERGIATRTELSQDAHVANVITRVAETHGADLIALSSHGLGGARRALLGSVADKVVRTGAAPVLIVHPGGSERQ
jgi:nucleotide-binding universal stress UspA family protein